MLMDHCQACAACMAEKRKLCDINRNSKEFYHSALLVFEKTYLGFKGGFCCIIVFACGKKG